MINYSIKKCYESHSYGSTTWGYLGNISSLITFQKQAKLGMIFRRAVPERQPCPRRDFGRGYCMFVIRPSTLH